MTQMDELFPLPSTAWPSTDRTPAHARVSVRASVSIPARRAEPHGDRWKASTRDEAFRATLSPAHRSPLPGGSLDEQMGAPKGQCRRTGKFFLPSVSSLSLYLRIDKRLRLHDPEGTGQMSREIRKAVAYLRTSSKANVGADKDLDKRQRAAIDAFAKATGYEIVETFNDAAVSGADFVGERAGFVAMLERLLSNGAKTVIVESPDRFARDLMVQLAGHDMLKAKGVT